MKKESMSVTPWEVSGDVDYSRLLQEFGTAALSPPLVKKLKDAPALIKSGVYFSHRDFDLWLAAAQAGKRVSILSGRGPSEKMHLGHIVPFMLAKYLQDTFGCSVYIPISEDEKFFVKPHLSFEKTQEYADDNILDVLALGFKQGKTWVMRDFSYAPLYPQAARVAKLMSYSTAKAAFGLQPENNLGWSFYPAVQAAHILLPQFIEGPHPTLVPVGIDQDPFIRLTRDIAAHPSLGLQKPAALHARFIPSLKGASKMSSSDEQNAVIYLSDSADDVKMKINRYAFSGGKDTLEEHRKHGGNPDVDISFQYLKMLFEPNEKKIAQLEKDYRSGKLLSGELKKIAIEKITGFLKEHQKAREKIKKNVSKFMLR